MSGFGLNKAEVALLKDLAQTYAEHDTQRAHAFADRALAIADDPVGVASVRCAKALVLFYEGRFSEARALFESALPAFEQRGSLPEIVGVQAMVGQCARREGAFHEARTWLTRALEAALADGEVYNLQEALQEFAALALCGGAFHTAARLLGASERLRCEVGAPIWDPNDREQTIEVARAALGDNRFECEWQAGAVLTDDEAVALAARVH